MVVADTFSPVATTYQGGQFGGGGVTPGGTYPHLGMVGGQYVFTDAKGNVYAGSEQIASQYAATGGPNAPSMLGFNKFTAQGGTPEQFEAARQAEADAQMRARNAAYDAAARGDFSQVNALGLSQSYAAQSSGVAKSNEMAAPTNQAQYSSYLSVLGGVTGKTQPLAAQFQSPDVLKAQEVFYTQQTATAPSRPSLVSAPATQEAKVGWLMAATGLPEATVRSDILPKAAGGAYSYQQNIPVGNTAWMTPIPQAGGMTPAPPSDNRPIVQMGFNPFAAVFNAGKGAQNVLPTFTPVISVGTPPSELVSKPAKEGETYIVPTQIGPFNIPVPMKGEQYNAAVGQEFTQYETTKAQAKLSAEAQSALAASPESGEYGRFIAKHPEMAAQLDVARASYLDVARPEFGKQYSDIDKKVSEGASFFYGATNAAVYANIPFTDIRPLKGVMETSEQATSYFRGYTTPTLPKEFGALGMAAGASNLFVRPIGSVISQTPQAIHIPEQLGVSVTGAAGIGEYYARAATTQDNTILSARSAAARNLVVTEMTKPQFIQEALVAPAIFIGAKGVLGGYKGGIGGEAPTPKVPYYEIAEKDIPITRKAYAGTQIVTQAILDESGAKTTIMSSIEKGAGGKPVVKAYTFESVNDVLTRSASETQAKGTLKPSAVTIGPDLPELLRTARGAKPPATEPVTSKSIGLVQNIRNPITQEITGENLMQIGRFAERRAGGLGIGPETAIEESKMNIGGAIESTSAKPQIEALKVSAPQFKQILESVPKSTSSKLPIVISYPAEDFLSFRGQAAGAKTSGIIYDVAKFKGGLFYTAEGTTATTRGYIGSRAYVSLGMSEESPLFKSVTRPLIRQGFKGGKVLNFEGGAELVTTPKATPRAPSLPTAPKEFAALPERLNEGVVTPKGGQIQIQKAVEKTAEFEVSKPLARQMAAQVAQEVMTKPIEPPPRYATAPANVALSIATTRPVTTMKPISGQTRALTQSFSNIQLPSFRTGAVEIQRSAPAEIQRAMPQELQRPVVLERVANIQMQRPTIEQTLRPVQVQRIGDIQLQRVGEITRFRPAERPPTTPPPIPKIPIPEMPKIPTLGGFANFPIGGGGTPHLTKGAKGIYNPSLVAKLFNIRAAGKAPKELSKEFTIRPIYGGKSEKGAMNVKDIQHKFSSFKPVNLKGFGKKK